MAHQHMNNKISFSNPLLIETYVVSIFFLPLPAMMLQWTLLCIFPHAHMGIFNCTYLNVRLLAWGVCTDTGKLLFKMAVPTYRSALNLRADLFCHCCFTLCPPVCSHRDFMAQALWRDHALPDPLTPPCFSHIGARPVLVKIVLSTMRSPSIPPAGS